MKKRSKIVSIIVITLLLCTFNSFAQDNETTEKKDSYELFTATLREDDSIDENVFSYVENAVGRDEMMDMLGKYQEVYPGEEAYLALKNNIEGIYQEAQAYNFSQEQIKGLFITTANLETGNAEISEMTFSEETPSYAPSHTAEVLFEKNKELYHPSDIDLLSNNGDRSARTGWERAGVGYEVKSKLGYNKTTTFLNAGKCNVTDESGRAGYMFYTIYCNNKYQDIGIGYFNGRWNAFVSGNWTGWGKANVAIKPGNRVYFKIWIGNDSRIYFAIFDERNFNRPLYQNSYTTHGEIPSSGYGVGFNRQITFVDDYKKSNSKLYLRGARFNQSYIYNNYATETFNRNNTESSRRGKFGCDWASDSTVDVINNGIWNAETVSIYMNE